MTPLPTPPEVEAYEKRPLRVRLSHGELVVDKRQADAALAARTRQAEELAKELERAQSWDGIIDHLNRVYPAETFTGYSGDGGPTIVALTRALYAIGQTLDRTIDLASENDALRAEVERLTKERDEDEGLGGAHD